MSLASGLRVGPTSPSSVVRFVCSSSKVCSVLSTTVSEPTVGTYLFNSSCTSKAGRIMRLVAVPGESGTLLVR